MNIASIIFIWVAFVLFSLGILIKHFKCYELIAGYNTEPREKQKKYDIVGLSRLVGNSLFVMAGFSIITAILLHLNHNYAIAVFLFGIILPVAYILINEKKFGPYK
ncbi:MAG: DUF3784 domain-containing protein [Candidatus Diapherotrites archaeon]